MDLLVGSLQVRRAGVSLMDCPRYCAGVEQVSSVRVRLPFSHLGRGEKEDGELKKGTNHHGHRWHHEWRGLGRELLSTWAAFGTLLLPGIARGGTSEETPGNGGEGRGTWCRTCADVLAGSCSARRFGRASASPFCRRGSCGAAG